MRIINEAARATRPLRRVVTPWQFKEHHINRALKGRHDAIYLEIGVRDGESFRKVKADRKIGIDPDRRPAMAHLSAGEEFFNLSSDDFFAGSEATKLRYSVDVALIDGLHEFEQSLRDFLNLEPLMKPTGIIFIDDCNPRTRAHAEVRNGGAWNGDVWRTAALLCAERKDLSVLTLDCDQGLGVVKGFGSGKRPPPLPRHVLDRYKYLDYSELNRDRQLIHLQRPSIALK